MRNTTRREAERAYLVGVELRGRETLFDIEDSLSELAQLADTAGIEVAGRDIQRLAAPHAGTFIGSGKAEEIAQLRAELGFDLVIFDDELSPAQLRNLEEVIACKILDRTALILDIFALHARTKEGALQVELAQYAYRLPRLTRAWTHLSRQGVGGVGLRGPGETQLESDRREIGHRMATLRREIEEVRAQRALQRRRRRRQGLPVVGIVGYTNAGKSTLLNCLSGAGVLAEDRLFATLDPTTRRVALPSGKEVLFTDTVGFIQKLPTELVAAFRATLEEVQEADLLIHVVDISDRNLALKIEAVERVLGELEAANKPTIIALNKVDLVDPESELTPGEPLAMRHTAAMEVMERYPRVAAVSAAQGVGIEDLLAEVEDLLMEQMVEVEATLPYQAGDLLALWRKQGVIEAQHYTAKGTVVRGRLPHWLLGALREEVKAIREIAPDDV